MKKNNPLVSVVIVNWNGKSYLEKCLQSLQRVYYKEVEVIVVDQNSSDGSQEMVRKKFQQALLIVNKENTGYVGGNNLGAKKARGKYLLILNNDILVERNFLEPLVEVFEQNPKLGVAQPKAINLRFKGKLDGGGSFFTNSGFLYHKGYLDRADKKEYSKRYYVYSVKGAYMMTRRTLFNKLGGLDKDFFIYFEESDYCGRVWLAGYKVEYIPESVVYHWGGSDTKEDWEKRFALVQYRSFKNRICSYIKNLSPRSLIVLLPFHLLLCEGAAFYYLIRGKFQVSVSIQKAILWNLFNMRATLNKRWRIQRMRKLSDREIFLTVEKSIEPMYYLQQLSLLDK